MQQPRIVGIMRVLALMGSAGSRVAEALPLTLQDSSSNSELDFLPLTSRDELPADTIPSAGTAAGKLRPFSQPINVAFITIGIFCGILVLGWGVYSAYRRWALSRTFDPSERMWPPVTAGEEEISQLVELIRIGMIDGHGAPPHVVNWIVHGVNAPWPPLEGIENLTRRRRRRRNRALGLGLGGGSASTRTAAERAEQEARRRARRRARAAAQAQAAQENDPEDTLPPYVCNPAQDSNHHPPPAFPMAEIPREYSPPQFSAFGAPLGRSATGTGTMGGIASADSSRPVSGASDILEEAEVQLSGLSPRPLPAHIR